jgi:hypothetical protein
VHGNVGQQQPQVQHAALLPGTAGGHPLGLPPGVAGVGVALPMMPAMPPPPVPGMAAAAGWLSTSFK